MEINRHKCHQVNDCVIEVKYDTAKLVFGLQHNHGIHIGFLLCHDLSTIRELVHLDKEPGSKHVDHDMHVLAKSPSDISSGDEVDKGVNVDSSSWVSYRPNITQQLGVICSIWII